MAGKIHEKTDFWLNELEPSSFIQNVILHKYSLPFHTPCPPFAAKNNASSRKNYDFVVGAIDELVRKKCVIEVDSVPYCCNPLTVSDRKDKLRLVLDLRHVNKYIQEFSIKYEDLKFVEKIFEQGFYFQTFDLTSGYHHVGINPEHWKYLGFSWTYANGVTIYYVFVVLPFGLSSACYVFTKLLRPLVAKWRGVGIRCLVYLDDGIFGASNELITKIHSNIVLSDLEKAGFTINLKKSVLDPTQESVWLGFIINTRIFKFYVPSEKMEKVTALINTALRLGTASARHISRIAGNIISMETGIGPLARLFTRHMYSFIDNTTIWDKIHTFGQDVTGELLFWVNNLISVNGYSIKPQHAITKIVYSDASDHSYGAFIVEKLGNEIAHGTFSHQEALQSSTFRELSAVSYTLKGFQHLLQNQCVLWHSDSLNTAKIIRNGSPKKHLQTLALDIFRTCLRYDIRLIPKWIPREENELADSISKYSDSDNWGIDNESFDYLQHEFGTFTVDRFADSQNAKTNRFDSRYHTPGAENINTFTSNWREEFNWVCPPISCIATALKHAKICRSTGVLLIPEWKSSYFWPLITPNGRHFYDFIKKSQSTGSVFLQ